MQIEILDGNAQGQTVVWQAPATPVAAAAAVWPAAPPGGVGPLVDRSGVIVAGPTQTLMPANPGRSGWIVQNNSATGNSMTVNDLGNPANGAGSFVIPPGGYFPPPGYVVTNSDIEIGGAVGDAFTAREW
jgi:hypothetical protein